MYASDYSQRKPFYGVNSGQIDLTNLDWYHGDDLFRLAWIGPRFRETDPKYGDKMSELRRVFQGHNVLKELVDNWKDGLISQPFTWNLKTPEGDRTDAPDAEIALQRWLDWVNQQATELDPAASNFEPADVWAEFILSLGVIGEGNLRLWQPKRFADDPDPIHRIHLHAPKAGSIMLRRDDDGFIEEISYSYERYQVEGDRVIVQTPDEELEIDTGGRWPVQHVRGRSLLSQSAKQKQAGICHALTMLVRNQSIAGFKERTLINCEFPEEDVERGPGIDQYLYGIPQGDPREPNYASPSVVESQPVGIGSFVEAVQLYRTLLYLEFKQGHLLSAGDGGLSGESRIQMRQGFELHLRGWKRPVEGAIANVLNIVLRLLGYGDLQAVVSLNITTGKLSAEERRQLLEEYNAGLLSKSTTIATLGTVGDVDSELALLDEERREQEARQAVPQPNYGLVPFERANGRTEPPTPIRSF
jgi:hypothetical protein